jgi:hypothetical protein
MVFVYPTLILLNPCPVSGQTAPGPVRDPNAIALANRALQALTGGTAITDITIQASATYIAGSDQEMGPATLMALETHPESLPGNCALQFWLAERQN